MLCHRAEITSNWFVKHDNKITVIKWPLQSPDLSPTEHQEQEICITEVEPANQQQLCDYRVSMHKKLSEECLHCLVESMPQRIKAVLKTKRCPTSEVFLSW